MKFNKEIFFSLIIRNSSQGIKFLFILALIEKYSSSFIADLNYILYSSILISTISGIGLYGPVNRCIAEDRPYRLRVQKGHLCIVTTFSIVASLLIAPYSTFSGLIVIGVSIIYVLEAITNELVRYSFVSYNPIKSSIYFFVKSVGWLLISWPFLFTGEYEALLVIVGAWILVLGVLVFVDKGIYFSSGKIDYRWYLLNGKESFYHYIIGVMYKCYEFAPFYLYLHYYSKVEAGVYSFYFSMITLGGTVAHLVVTQRYLKIILSEKNISDYYDYKREMIFLSLVVFSIIYGVGNLFPVFLDDDNINESIDLLIPMLLMMLLNNIALVNFNFQYANKQLTYQLVSVTLSIFIVIISIVGLKEFGMTTAVWVSSLLGSVTYYAISYFGHLSVIVRSAKESIKR